MLVDAMVTELLAMDPKAWQYQMQHAQHSVTQLSQNIAALHAHISLLEMPVSTLFLRTAALKAQFRSADTAIDANDAGSQHVHDDRAAMLSLGFLLNKLCAKIYEQMLS